MPNWEQVVTNFSPKGFLDMVKDIFWIAVKAPFEFWHNLPEPVRLAVKIALGCVALLIAVLVYKDRDKWMKVVP